MNAIQELRTLSRMDELTTHERRRVQAILTSTLSSSLPDHLWPWLDALWSAEAARRPVEESRDLDRWRLPSGSRNGISLWWGDITRLRVDAIVNAANSGLTGCYQPFHACVDNAIHTAAGPRLRLSCERVMAVRGRPEPTGTATVTEGYHLPASFVVHTVGPIIADRRPTPAQAAQLAACYRDAIRAVAEIGLESIAFCAISTGVFGYPMREASEVAVAAIAAATSNLGDLAPHVVVVAYSEPDHETYRQVLAASGVAVPA